ncbi:hypothetical protein ACKUB1_13625 [Methanospirillum stamsii]|nr:hypothetical protein [Methanospirillum stamsii]
MVTKTTMKKLEAQGFTMKNLQASWETFEKEGWTYQDWDKMMKVRAENP